MNLYFGVVTKVEDKEKFIIRATIENWVEDIIAYPIDTFDEPNVGDPIDLYEIETVFGYCFQYKKQRQFGHTRLKLGDQMIDITRDKVTITSGMSDDDLDEDSSIADADAGIKIATKSKRTIEIDSEGELVVHSGKDTTINIDKNCDIQVKGSLKIDVTGSCDVKARSVNIEGNMIKVKGSSGSVAPTGSGPFCAIPICPFTGAPHVGDTLL